MFASSLCALPPHVLFKYPYSLPVSLCCMCGIDPQCMWWSMLCPTDIFYPASCESSGCC